MARRWATLRALASLGNFVEDGEFRQTSWSDTLRRARPDSAGSAAMMLGAHFVWQPSGGLGETVRTGQPSFERLQSAAFFEYMASHPNDAAVFNATMIVHVVDVAIVIQRPRFRRPVSAWRIDSAASARQSRALTSLHGWQLDWEWGIEDGTPELTFGISE